MSKLLKVLSYADVAKRAVEVLEAYNSSKVYKHKDKVDKVLQGAYKALSVVQVVKGIASK